MAVQPVELSDVGSPAIAAVGGKLRQARRFGNLDVLIPAVLLALILAACFLGPWVLPIPPPLNGNVLDSNLPMFAAGHFFGTDAVGNDTLSEILHGGQISLEIALGTNLVGLAVGGALGTVAAYAGGLIEAAVMRVLDVLIAIPSLVLALVVAQALQPSELHVIWALSFFSVPGYARIARSATLKVRDRDFMLAARLSGTRRRRALVRHVAPLILPQLLTFALVFLGVTILVSAALSYLGLSVPPPTPTWGGMISTGQPYLSSDPRLVLVPSAFLFITVLCFNLLGDAVRARWARA